MSAPTGHPDGGAGPGRDPLPDAVRAAPWPVRAWLLLAGWCGLTAAQIAGLRGDQITRRGGRWLLLVPDRSGGTVAQVPLAAAVRRHLAAELPARGRCFPDATVERVTDEVAAYLAGRGLAGTTTLEALRRRVRARSARAAAADAPAASPTSGRRAGALPARRRWVHVVRNLADQPAHLVVEVHAATGTVGLSAGGGPTVRIDADQADRLAAVLTQAADRARADRGEITDDLDLW